MNQISLYDGTLADVPMTLFANQNVEGKLIYLTHLIVHNTLASPVNVRFFAMQIIIDREMTAKDTWFIELPKLGITLHEGEHFHGSASIADVVNVRAFGFVKLP